MCVPLCVCVCVCGVCGCHHRCFFRLHQFIEHTWVYGPTISHLIFCIYHISPPRRNSRAAINQKESDMIYDAAQRLYKFDIGYMSAQRQKLISDKKIQKIQKILLSKFFHFEKCVNTNKIFIFNAYWRAWVDMARFSNFQQFMYWSRRRNI